MSESRCRCGFVFDADATTGSYQALEIAVQEAKVYAEYLLVRMNQAKEAADVAIAAKIRQTADSAGIPAADSANQEFLATKAEYDAQMKQLAQLQREVAVAREQEEQATQRTNAWRSAEQRARKKKGARKTKPAAPKPAPATAPGKKSGAASPTTAGPTANNVGQASPPAGLQKKLATAGNVAATGAKSVRGTATTKSQTAPGASASGRTAKKATPAFTAKQAAKASATHKECPNCTALVPLAADTCKCGYGFAKGTEQMDGVSLSDEDRALLGLTDSTKDG